MPWYKWIWIGALMAVGTIISYRVYLKVNTYRRTKASAGSKTSQQASALQPGVIGNLKNALGGMFSFGPTPASPPVPGGYGVVGAGQTVKSGTSAHVQTNDYTRVPEFVEASPGTIDPVMAANPPPPGILGPPAPGGVQMHGYRSYKAAGSRNNKLLSTAPPMQLKGYNVNIQ